MCTIERLCIPNTRTNEHFFLAVDMKLLATASLLLPIDGEFMALCRTWLLRCNHPIMSFLVLELDLWRIELGLLLDPGGRESATVLVGYLSVRG